MAGVVDDRVRVEVADPPVERLTLAGLKLPVKPRGAADAESVTVPEKPFKLVKWIVEVGDEPDCIQRLVGLLETLRPAVATPTCTVTTVE